MQRIHVVGTSGSGKTMLAKQIAQQLQLPHVELDALHWEPNWTAADTNVFRERVERALQNDRWVVDGNYSRVRDLIWNQADTIVWLDYPFWLVFCRIVWRTLRRGLTRQPLWNNNRESLAKGFGRESMILWMLKTYQRRRQEYPAMLSQHQQSHPQVEIITLRSVRSTQKWLKSLDKQSALPTRGALRPQ
jgi:adenylate kinase family enzyme